MDAVLQMSNLRSSCHATQSSHTQLDDFLIEARSSCVLVVENEQMIGILTERDIIRLSTGPQPLTDLTLRQVMIQPVITLRDAEFKNLLFAINLLQQHGIRHLPVVDDQNRPIGIVTHESLRHFFHPIDLLQHRRVQEVMTHEVVSATAESSLMVIAQLMADRRISSVVITKNHLSSAQSSPIPLGIITERDLVQFQALGLSLASHTAAVAMSTPVFAVEPEESLWTVQQIMEQRFIRRLVVTGSQGELLGIITQSSLLRILNPIELYSLAELLEQKVNRLEAEKIALLESRAAELAEQVEARTTALKTQADREKLLAEITTQIRSSLSLQTILETTVEQVRQVLGCDRVNIWRFQANWQSTVVAESTQSPLSLIGEQVNDTCFKQDMAEIYREGHIRIVPDVQTATMTDCHRQLLERLQTRAKVLVPLLCGDQLWGLLNASESQHQRNWQPEEVDLLRAIAAQLAIALQQATTYEQLQAELTERKQAEARLKESEQRYATLAAAAPVGIFRTNAAGQCIYINYRWCQITGISPTAAAGYGWQQGFHAEDRDQVIEEWQRATQEHRPFQMEYRFQRPDGVVTWVYGQIVAERNPNGTLNGYVGTITDISDRKEAERLITDSENKFRSIFDHAAVGIVYGSLKGGHGKILACNPRFCKLLGYTAAELHQLTVAEITHPDDRSIPALPQLIAGEIPHFSMEKRYFRKDGTVLWSNTTVSILRDDQGNPLNTVVIVEDISERKLLEIKRQQAELALQQSEAQSRAVLSAIPDLMFLTGTDGVYRKYIKSNRSVDMLAQFDSLVGMPMTDVLPPEIAQRHLYFIRQALNTGNLQVYEQQVKIGDRIQDEEVRIIQNGDDEVLFMIRDISDRKRAENSLRESEERYRSIYDQAVVGFANANLDGQFLNINPYICKLLGYPREELLNKTIPDITHPEDRQQIAPAMQRLFSGEISYFVQEKRYLRKDGSHFWSNTCVSLVRDSQGQPKHTLAIIQDISERKQAEAALQSLIAGTAATTGKDFFPALVSHIAQALNVAYAMVTERVDETLKVLAIWADGALQTTFSYSSVKTPCEWTLRDGIFHCDHNLQQHFPEDLDLVEMGADSYLGIALQDVNGQAIGNLCILDRHAIQDIDRAKNLLRVFAARAAAELQRQQANTSLEQLNQALETKVAERTAALQEREKFLQTVLDTFPLSVFWKDRDSVYLGCNRIFLEDAGLSSTHEITHKTDYDMPWAETDAEAFRADDQQVMGTDTAKLGIIETLRRVDGQQIWLETNKLPLHNLQGEVIGVLGTYQDITARQQAEATIRQQANREKLLREITQRIRQSLDLQTIFDTACEEIRTVLQADRVGIFKLDPEAQYNDGEFVAESVVEGFTAVTDMSMHDHRFGEKYASLYAQGRFYVVDDIYQNELSDCHTDILLTFQVRANVVVPLLCNQALWGLLCIHQCDAARHWQQSEIDLIQQLANQLAIAIQQASLYEQMQSELVIRKQAELKLQQQAQREHLLASITQRVRSSLNLEEILNSTVEELHQVLQADRVLVYRVFPEGTGAAIAEAVTPGCTRLLDLIFPEEVFPPENYQRYVQGRVFALNDREAERHLVLPCLADFLAEIEVSAKLVVPIVQKQTLWGLLIAHQCHHPYQWKPWEINLLQQIANQLSIAIQQSSLFEQLQQELIERQQAQSLLTKRNDQLAVSNEELARATRLKDEFLANMSHELRTPLNAILGMTEGLQDKIFGDINSDQTKALKTIERSGSHLLELINDILDVAKIESGQIELELLPVAIDTLCRASLTFVKQQSHKKRIQLELKLPSQLPELRVDERRIRQVLINLLNNAVKFTPEGGHITLEVSYHTSPATPPPLQGITRVNVYSTSTPPNLSAGSPPQPTSLKNYLSIAVIDTGIGIAPEQIQKLFQPFVQIDSALNRQYSGTGLGLALVKRIVELHGGKVTLTSQVGVGSRFTINLPCAAIVTPTPALESPPEPTIQLQQNAADTLPLVLLAEDNEANISTISSYLKAKGYQLLLAKNGQDAIALAQTQNPDLILMDIQMPGMDGLEAMRQIRLNPDLVEVPIIALTALAMTGDRDRCLEAGANDYLSKPIKLKQLVTAIQQQLAQA